MFAAKTSALTVTGEPSHCWGLYLHHPGLTLVFILLTVITFTTLVAHNKAGMEGPNVLMQMNDYVSSFTKAVTGLLAPSMEGLAVNSGLFAATPKYHNHVDCMVL